jgi:hypothetical protein
MYLAYTARRALVIFDHPYADSARLTTAALVRVSAHGKRLGALRLSGWSRLGPAGQDAADFRWRV